MICPAHGPRNDNGETLVEILLSIVIMSIGIVGLLGVLSTTLVATDTHRRLSDTEVYARTYGEAVKNKALRPATTTLKSAVADHNAGASLDIFVTIPVSDFPTTAPFGIAIDGEVMSVTAVTSPAPLGSPVNSAKWTVTAGGGEAHANGAVVTAYESCPTVTDLRPTTFAAPPAATRIGLPSVTAVQYYAPNSTTPIASCSTYWSGATTVCRSQGAHRTECDPAVIRATVSVISTDTDSRRQSSTTTEVLLRRNNA